MPVTKILIDDLGSQAFKELVDAVSAAEVKSAVVSTGSIADAATGSAVFLMTDVDLVVTDVMVASDAAADWADTTTDLFIEHDTDTAFGSATAVLSREGFNTNNFPAGLSLASDAPEGDGTDVTTMPFILPAGAALRARLVNNEGGALVAYFGAKYIPMDDLIALVPNVSSGKVLKEVDRP